MILPPFSYLFNQTRQKTCITFVIDLLQSNAVIKKIDITKMSEDDKNATFREAKILEVL